MKELEQEYRELRWAKPDPTSAQHLDLVKRGFAGTALNLLRGANLTFLPTCAGVAHACSIIDLFFQMIVGWRAASHKSVRHLRSRPSAIRIATP